MTIRVSAVLDVGGTSIKPGVVRGERAEALAPLRSRSNGSTETILDQLAAALDTAINAAGPFLNDAVMAVPRPFDLDRGIPLLHGLHKFDSIHGIELRPILRSRTAIDELPILFVGDAEAAAIGEALFGAGRRFDRVLTITLGTGMGACLTEAGRVVTHAGGALVEDLHDRPFRRGRADDAFSARGLAAHLGVDVDALRTVVADPASADQMADFGRRLSEFLAPILDEFGADAVVVGGGLSAAFETFGPAMDITVRRAELGARGPLLGATALTAPGD